MIQKMINDELKAFNVTWADFKEVKTLKSHVMGNNRKDLGLRIIVVEYHDHYQVRFYNLNTSKEVLIIVPLGHTGVPLRQFTRQDFNGDEAKGHFNFYKKLTSNLRHQVTFYKI